MSNKGKIEELDTEIQRLNSLVEGLSKFGTLGILEVTYTCKTSPTDTIRSLKLS